MRVPLFSCLSRKELEVIAAILHERSYIANEIIFDEGDEGLGMYIIVEGKARVSKNPEANAAFVKKWGIFFTIAGSISALTGIVKIVSAR